MDSLIRQHSGKPRVSSRGLRFFGTGAVVYRGVLLCLAAVLLAGCKSAGSNYREISIEDAGRAMIVIYRPPPPITIPPQYIEYPPHIYQGPDKLVELLPNAYTRIEVAPGLKTFTARIRISGEIQGAVNIDAAAGSFYYLRYVPFRYRGLLPADSHEFKLVPAAFAREELRDARYQPPLD